MRGMMAGICLVLEAVLMGKRLFRSGTSVLSGKRDLRIPIWAGSSLLAAAVGWRLGFRTEGFLAALGPVLAFLGLSASMLTDWESRIISNRILCVMGGGWAVLFLADRVTGRETDWGNPAAALGFLAGLFLLSLVTGGGLGMGDVKLTAALSLLAGGSAALSSLFLALLFSAGWSVVRLVRRKTTLKDEFAFAPFLFAGYAAVLLTGSL